MLCLDSTCVDSCLTLCRTLKYQYTLSSYLHGNNVNVIIFGWPFLIGSVSVSETGKMSEVDRSSILGRTIDIREDRGVLWGFFCWSLTLIIPLASGWKTKDEEYLQTIFINCTLSRTF